MENASKALIIAGAILLAILLITLGIVVFNSAKGTTDQAGVVGKLMKTKAEEYQIDYKNQNIGEKGTFTFILKPNEYEKFNQYKDEDLYLSLRLARTNDISNFKVKIENIKIKYKAE